MKHLKLSFYDKFEILLTNMKLNDIPTQNSRVFLCIKQNHFKKVTKAAQIEENHVAWSEDANIKCTLPKTIKKEKKKYLLYISVRFENATEHGCIHYGHASIDVASLKTTKEIHLNIPLEHCMENSIFSADIINFNPFNALSSPNDSELATSFAINEAQVSAFSGPSTFSLGTTQSDMPTSELTNSDNNKISSFQPSSIPVVNVTLFDHINVKVKQPEMEELENQVNGIVATIINNNFE